MSLACRLLNEYWICGAASISQQCHQFIVFMRSMRDKIHFLSIKVWFGMEIV
ncbi:hypothetical protein yinte0001_26430 [Yersinia intermedia ATCC 29909]|nr:hypothetical protein yinte0001_26430 [Yersinia intermedia ATCC 29909]